MSVSYLIYVEEVRKVIPLVTVEIVVEVDQWVKLPKEETKKGTVTIVGKLVLLSSFVVFVPTMTKMVELESPIIILVVIEMHMFWTAPQKADL